MSPQEFAERYWGRAPLLSSAADLPASFDDLLTLDAVDELVSRRGLRTPFVRMARDGQVLDAARFTRAGGAGAEVADQVDGDRVLRLFAEGATLVLQGLHRVWPPLVHLAARLSSDLGHPVQVNAYITPPQSTGFSPHHDVHDVFVLQVAGSKQWTVHAPVIAEPLRDEPWTSVRAQVVEAASGEPALEAELRPGDALYLPRGWLHSARALGETSAHLTVGIQPLTRHAVAEELFALAARQGDLRAALPVGVDVADAGGLAPTIDETVEALVGALRAVDPEAVAAALRRRAWSAVRPDPVAPLAQAAAARSLTPSSAVVVRPHLRWVLRADGGELLLEREDRTTPFPPAQRPALERVLDGTEVTAADLPGLDTEAALYLVRRLLREAVVVPVAP